MSAFQRNVRRAEDSIRNEQTEHLMVLDSKGNVAARSGDGQRSEVSFTPEMERLARDAVVTHNHPGGSTFSWEDIHASMLLGIKEVRATTASNGTYVLRRDYDLGGYVPGSYRDFAYDYRSYVNTAVIPSVRAKLNSGQIKTSDEAYAADGRMRRDWLKNNSKRYGWTYREEK